MTATVEIVEALTEAEGAALAECESVITAGLMTFYAVGDALLQIRDQRLYRGAVVDGVRCDTFAQYCRLRWNMSDSRARQLIGASQSFHEVESVTDVTLSEAVLRPLSGLEPEEKRTAIVAALSDAQDEGTPVAARHVEQAVAEIKRDVTDADIHAAIQRVVRAIWWEQGRTYSDAEIKQILGQKLGHGSSGGGLAGTWVMYQGGSDPRLWVSYKLQPRSDKPTLRGKAFVDWVRFVFTLSRPDKREEAAAVGVATFMADAPSPETVAESPAIPRTDVHRRTYFLLRTSLCGATLRACLSPSAPPVLIGDCWWLPLDSRGDGLPGHHPIRCIRVWQMDEHIDAKLRPANGYLLLGDAFAQIAQGTRQAGDLESVKVFIAHGQKDLTSYWVLTNEQHEFALDLNAVPEPEVAAAPVESQASTVAVATVTGNTDNQPLMGALTEVATAAVAALTRPDTAGLLRPLADNPAPVEPGEGSDGDAPLYDETDSRNAPIFDLLEGISTALWQHMESIDEELADGLRQVVADCPISEAPISDFVALWSTILERMIQKRIGLEDMLRLRNDKISDLSAQLALACKQTEEANAKLESYLAGADRSLDSLVVEGDDLKLVHAMAARRNATVAIKPETPAALLSNMIRQRAAIAGFEIVAGKVVQS